MKSPKWSFLSFLFQDKYQSSWNCALVNFYSHLMVVVAGLCHMGNMDWDFYLSKQNQRGHVYLKGRGEK